MALAGIASRRKCESLIEHGEVAVNGEPVKDLGRQVDPEKDRITFRGRPLAFQKSVYFLLHKPAGYVTSASDPHAEKTVYRLLPRQLVGSHAHRSEQRVFPVGRLDQDSTGLLLFTNDGDLANQLTHPRYEVPKEYEVEVDHPVQPADREKLLQGVHLEEGLARVEKADLLDPKSLRLTLREGKKREVRRILQTLGYRVDRLCRVSFGPLKLGTLPVGHGRFLTPAEITALKRASALSGLPSPQ